jgi:hypothetical protein
MPRNDSLLNFMASFHDLNTKRPTPFPQRIPISPGSIHIFHSEISEV